MPRPKKVESKVEKPKVEKPDVKEKKTEALLDCPDCWKPGLKDADTICPTCKGSGKVV